MRTTKKDSWTEQFEEVARLGYAMLRSCPQLPLLATSIVNPKHPIPSRQVNLVKSLFRSPGEESEAVDKSDRTSTRDRLKEILRTLGMLTAVRMVRAWVRCLAYALDYTLTNVRLNLTFRPFLKELRAQPATIILRTTCTDLRLLESPDDFFYGKLPSALQERRVNCLILCNDYWGGFSGEHEAEFVHAILTRKSIRSVPERILVPLWAPLLTAGRQMLTSLTLRRLAKKAQDEKLAKAYRYASAECLEPETMLRILTFYSARNAVKIWQADVLMTLYEGAAEEKLAWHGAKAAKKDCLTVGYQLGVIKRHSLSLTRPNVGSWELASPDVVLCLGQTTMRMMEPGQPRDKTKLILFGSYNRALSPSLQRRPQPERRTVLVVPEGSSTEAKYLFNFAMRLASVLPDHHFIFRCHPARSFSEYRSVLEHVPEEFPNIEISDRKSLLDDCARSSIVLYRGTSAVLVALLCGLKPIYLPVEGTPEIDSLFDLNGWCEQVSSLSQTEQLLRDYAAVSVDCATREWERAAAYVNGYAIPADETSVDRFLNAVNVKTDGTGQFQRSNMVTSGFIALLMEHVVPVIYV